MGNQLAGIVPSQIFPVEHYLTDLPEFQFDVSLGSTRFLKVARAKYREGLVVVKVFVIHDPTLPLKSYKDQLEDIKSKLSAVPNCIPFQRYLLTEKAGLLFRQYGKDNLYDRISTRPFLNSIEKKWIAFQIINAVNQCHKAGVCHGDIKLENIMVTGWHWVLLMDFASFKPTYLPEDNPADFSYFFDTSRRRICYIAPERFVKTLNADIVGSSGSTMVLADDEIKKGDLMPAMDIFSLGCVLTELFTEGHNPFDFSQLLSYRNGKYSPCKVLEKIDDANIKEIVSHMMQKEPHLRLSAEEYLQQQRGKIFPEYFYSFLYVYLKSFSGSPLLSPDDKINRLQRDLKNIMNTLCFPDGSSEQGNEESAEGLVIIVSVIMSCLRSLKHSTAKLQALEMLVNIAPHLSPEIVLDRLTPYLLYLVNDSCHHVRVAALRSLTKSLATVTSIPESDANIFPEYILPHLSHITQDPAVLVRIAYAENIALLAETALRFLEMTQLENNNSKYEIGTGDDLNVQQQASYDTELHALHEMIQQRVSLLLSDTDNIVKQTLMENGITRLCVFFGHQKANDVLLSHMVTFLNDKDDQQLRGSFFDCVVGVAAYVGWHSSTILKPLLQQGQADPEEFVIVKTLDAMTNLMELGLLQKPTLYELLSETAPFLCHPNLWIRHGAVGFICSAARYLNIADVHCKLLPLLLPFLRQPVIDVNTEVILLSVLKDPIPRKVYDGIVRSPNALALFACLQDRRRVRCITRPGHQPIYSEPDPIILPLHRRLASEGMNDPEEDKVYHMWDCLMKLHKSRASIESKKQEEKERDGKIDLSALYEVPRRQAELSKDAEKAMMVTPNRAVLPASKGSHKKVAGSYTGDSGMQDTPGGVHGGVIMNEEWQHMFGTVPSCTEAKTQNPRPVMTPPFTNYSPISVQGTLSASDSCETISTINTSIGVLSGMDVLNSPHSLHHQPNPEGLSNAVTEVVFAPCYLELQELIHKKIEEQNSSILTKGTMESTTLETSFPPPTWRPKGQLVAHLHEHRLAVNRVLTIPGTTLFTTCSDDGTVKIWDCGRMEGKSVANRSRQTYSRQEGHIVALAVCQNEQTIASASDNCSIHVFKYDVGTKISKFEVRHLDPQEDGCVVDMSYFSTGSQSVLTYATVYGTIYGWDLRSPSTAWRLENNSRNGLITSICVDPQQMWLVAGTSSGHHVCWDIRFQLPISCIRHPTGARVRRVIRHPTELSWIVSAVEGNNEVTMWDVETCARQMTLWASKAPALTATQSSNHSVHAMVGWAGEKAPLLLTAGSDMRIRFWDMHNVQNSGIIVPAANESAKPVVSYSSRLIDGTEVTQELNEKHHREGIAGIIASGNSEEMPRRGPNSPPAGHHDCISDLAVCQASQMLMISSSKNGVVKVWK